MKVIENNHEKELRTKTCQHCKSIIILTSPKDISDYFGHGTVWHCSLCDEPNSITTSEFPSSWRYEVYSDDIGH